jgi:tetratricopeptide (TPR) repeat protein
LIALYKQGRFQETLAHAEAMERQFQDEPFPADLAGTVFLRLGRLKQAVASYNRAIRIKPDYARAHNNLGNALSALGQYEEAVASFSTALQLEPDYAGASLNLGIAQVNLGMPEAAIVSYREALRVDPDFAEAHNSLGNALTSVGKPQDAIASYSEALRIKPGYSEAHWNMSHAKDYAQGDPHLDQMLQLLTQADISDHDRVNLNFALGKVHDDIGDYDEAFSYFSTGNSLWKEQLNYDIANDRALFARLKTTFAEDSPRLDAAEEPERQNSQVPVFILGMPRSGTSLVEQILASHSQVYGAGELSLLGGSVTAAGWNSTDLSSAQLETVRNSYLSGLQKLGTTERYVTDKMPHNFCWIGFICAMTTDAKIIHVQRDARAVCWSNFRNHFSNKNIGFANDLEDVAEYYKMCVDLMAFWHQRFPGRIYDLDYDALTEHQEDESRNLLEHVGLEWEDQCLSFHTTERAVQTTSATQVRQPMYQGSSRNWRNYEKHLGPLIDSLENV